MKVSKTGYKKNSKDKNEPALVIPSNKITMKGVEFPVYGIDDTGYAQMMYPGVDYLFPGSYVHELPMAKNGMSAPGPSKVIGGKLEISYDKDRNIYLRSLDSDTWNKIEGDQAKEFRTKFAQYMPGYFDPAANVKRIQKEAAKQVGTKQQVIADKPKYQEIPEPEEQSPLQQVAAGVPPMLAKSTGQQTFGDRILSEIGNPEKIRETKLQSKYQSSPDYHVTPYNSVRQANQAYEKTIDYKLRYKNLNDYSTEDIPKIQEKLYNEGYLQKPEQLDVSNYKSRDQVVELQKKLAKFGLMDMLGKGGPNKDGITGTLTKETKDAVKRFNELNQTYKSGELDDMTKQAIKEFKNSTDSKNAMGLPIVNPKELYDPNTGEPDTDKTYEAMNIFENSLKSKGYFLGDKGFDITESAASNPKISFNFKLNPNPTTAFGMCAAYVNGTVCEDDVVGDEARDELGFKGSAWHISENLQDKGGQLVFSGLPDRSTVNLNGKNEITGYLKSQLTSPQATAQLKDVVGDGNLWGKNTKVRPGDVVNIFFEGSNYTEEAYNQTKSLNNKFFTTHVGIVKADDDGNLYVEHNIHGKVEKDKIQDFIDGKVKGNGKNKVSLISGITRPKYVDGVDKDARIPVTGVSYYQTEDGKFNPKGIFANPGDYLAKSVSGENTHKYLTTIEKNKDKLLKDIPISETEFGKLMRVARVIPTLETYASADPKDLNWRPLNDNVKVHVDALKLKEGVGLDEVSMGFTRLKDASNLGEDLRQNLYQNDDSQLTNPVKAALPTFYLLSKNYLYLKEVANRNNIDITSDELAKLAGLSYNQSIGKVAGELVDKGSYQNYYNYRVKTATDPGGQFKYRQVMDLYDTQTMKEGGQMLPGRYKNPEGNWLNKYQTRGEVKTYASDPEYFNNKAILNDNSQFNELIKSKVYAGTHGWDPSSNSLVRLDKPVAVPKAVQEMSTADYGKKSYKERFESNTPAGKEVRKAAVAQGMKDMVQNPAFYAPGAVAAVALAGPTVVPAIGEALSYPAVVGSTTLPGVTAGNALGLGMGAYGAYSLGKDIDTGYYTSNAPTSDKVVRGLETGLNLLGTPGAMEATGMALSKATKPIRSAYNTVATGESALPIAWKSPAVGLTQSASDDMFRSLANSGKLTPEERALVVEYQHGSREFTGRGLNEVNQEKRQALNNIINKYKAEIGDDVVLTRMFSTKGHALGAVPENGRLYFGDRPTSFTAGVQPPGHGTSVNRLVIPRRYSKQMGDKFLVNQYDKPSEEVINLVPEKVKDFASAWISPTDRIAQERELIGTGLDFKQIGKVKNDIGGYDLIVKPNSAASPPPPKVNFRKGNVESYNPDTGMYEMYEVSLPDKLLPGRTHADVKPKMKNLRKDLGIGYMEHLANKYIPGFAREIPLDKGSGVFMDPTTGRLFDSNTRYWLNKEYGITPKIEPLLQDRASYIGKGYGTKVSESAKPIHKYPGIKWKKKDGGWLDGYQTGSQVPVRNPLSENQLRKGYTWSPEFGMMAPEVEVTAERERPYDLVSIPGGHGSMVTAKRYKDGTMGYTPETTAAMNASNEIARSNNVDPITVGLAAAASLPTAGRLVAGALPWLNVPATVGSKVLPGVTAGNALALGFGARSASMLGDDVSTGYYGSDAPLMDKIVRGADTGLGFMGTGVYPALGQGLGAGYRGLTNAGKYLTTQTPLRNAYKYNPWAFKANPEAYYHRSPNLENIINQETGMLQGFGQSEAGALFNETAGPRPGTGINLKKAANNQLYFSKGVPLDYGRYNSPRLGMSGQGYKGPYLVEIEGVPMGASTKGRLPGADPVRLESYAVSRRPIFVDEAKFYKEDWLRGYKPVDTPGQLPGSPNSMGPGPMMLGLPNYTHEVKNVDYFKKMLDSYGSNKLSNQSKKYFEGIINSVRRQEGLATKKQYDMLQRLRTGDFNYGKRGAVDSGPDDIDWLQEEIRFSTLPELNNPQASEVLDNFMTRINTPEGKRRLKELGITEKYVFDKLKIVGDENTLGHYWLNKIGLNPKLPEVKRVTRHEIEHAVQDAYNRSRLNEAFKFKWTDLLGKTKKSERLSEASKKITTDIDESLKGLELRRTPQEVDWNAIKTNDPKKDPSQLFNYISDKQRATNYFASGSGGKEKSAFLGEVQQYMMDQGILPKTSYTEVTPEMVKNTFTDAIFDETGGGKYLRLFQIMKPTEANYKLIADNLNKMLGVAPVVGLGTAAALQKEKDGGWLKRYQVGGSKTCPPGQAWDESRGLCLASPQTITEQNQKYQDAIKWHEDWMNSPMYKQMLYENMDQSIYPSNETLAGNYDPYYFDTKRKNRLAELKQTPLSVSAYPPSRGYEAEYSPLYKEIKVYPDGWNLPTVMHHEVRHAIEVPRYQGEDSHFNMPAKDYNYLQTLNTNRNFQNAALTKQDVFGDEKIWNRYKDYYTNPSEVNARLAEIRKQAQEQKVYDPFIQSVPDNFFKNFNNRALDELKNYYTDDEIQHMLNHFSYNQTQPNDTGVYKSKVGGPTKWLTKYQRLGEVNRNQVVLSSSAPVNVSSAPANFPWIDNQGKFRDVGPIKTEPKSFEAKVDDFLGNPQAKARKLSSVDLGPFEDQVDNRRHPLAAMYTTDNLGSSLGAAMAANALGAAHEISVLPQTIQSDGWYHGLMSTAEDLFNNAVGAGIGMLPIPTTGKESLLMYLSDNNKLPDGVSMSQGDMYWKKKNGGVKSSGEGYYDYINGYKGVSLSNGGNMKKGWLDNYKQKV